MISGTPRQTVPLAKRAALVESSGVTRTPRMSLDDLTYTVAALEHVLEELLGHHVADATRRAAAARIIPVIHQIVAVVEGDLLTCLDIARGDDPDVVVVQSPPRNWACSYG